MTQAVDILLAKMGKTRADFAQRRGYKGQLFRRNGVSNSSELKRIVALPRRDWQVGIGGRNGTADELVELLTALWKTPQGTMILRPIQAVMLAELHDFGGAFGPIRTSGGKTLITFLAASAIGAERPLLVVPAALVKITERKWKTLSEHWQLPDITIISYTFLSREENRNFLSEFQPDLIIADESHYLKNLQAACTKVVQWYRKDNPNWVFLPLSGTPTNRSLHDYAHLVEWALPRICPVPMNYGVRVEWALCLDECKTDVNALAPGALVELCNDEERELLKQDPLTAARRAFRRRFAETPGVVSLADQGVTIPLNIRAIDVNIDTPEIDEHFWILRKKWCTPDGQPFAEAVKLWAHCRELVCGFYYVWDPAPPKAWLRARTSWYRDVRHILSHNQRRLATEFQVAKACKNGEYKLASYEAWTAIRESFRPNNVPIWVHDKTIQFAARWMDENPDGIVWTEHRAFAHKLADVTGRPFFGAKGMDKKTGVLIEDAEGPVIASTNSNKEGRDLQHKWSKNLIISCAPNGTTFEQLLARTHRDGQKAESVEVEVLLGSSEHYYGFVQAIRDARYQQEIMGHPQKLMQANIELPSQADLSQRPHMRWKRGVKK